MIEYIIEQLDAGLETFLDLWTENLQRAGCSEFVFAHRDDAVKAFNALTSTLKELDSVETPISHEEMRSRCVVETSFFVGEARKQKSRGVPIDMCIDCFKAMRLAAETLIEPMVASDSAKLKALRLLRWDADVIEAMIIADWENARKDNVTRELEKANQHLTKEKNTYKNIFEATSNLVLITDAEGNLLEGNPEAMVFFAGKKIIGQFCGTVLDLPGTSLDELLEKTAPNQTHEINLSRDGFSRMFNLQIKPLTGISMSSQGVMLILSDITCVVDHRQMMEQRVVERTQALVNSEKMLDAIFQSVGKGILLIDSEQEIVKANQQASEIYGLPLEVLIGTQFCSLTDHTGCVSLNDIAENLVEGQRRSVELSSLYVDGKTFPSEITMTSMDLDDQKFWTVIVRDITNQKALENGLREEKLQSEEMNVTLKNVLKTIESDRRESEQNLTHRVSNSLLPALEKIRKERSQDVRSSYLNLLREQLISITSGFETELDADLLKLSRTELKICRFVKSGLSGKEICDAMNLAFETIQTHRKNIRKKLGLSGKNVNLHTYLANRNFELGGLEGE